MHYLRKSIHGIFTSHAAIVDIKLHRIDAKFSFFLFPILSPEDRDGRVTLFRKNVYGAALVEIRT